MNSPWNKDWLEMQKQYMAFLSAFGRAVTAEHTTATPLPEWQKEFQDWWQHNQADLSAGSQAVFSNILQHAKGWHSITAQLSDLLQSLYVDDKLTGDWQTVLAGHVEKMKSHLQDGVAGVADDIRQAGMPLPPDDWQTIFKSLWPAAETAAPDFPFTALRDQLQQYFSLPGPGQNREWQKRVEASLRLGQAVQDSYLAYRHAHYQLALNSLDKFQTKILTLARQGKAITSACDFYDLWVDTHEAAYADYILTAEYATIYAQLINSMLAFRAHTQAFLADCSRALSLPTADEQQALLHELRDIKRQQEEDKKRLKLLEDKIKQLAVASSTGASSPAPVKKKLRKKKLRKKKLSKKKAGSRSVHSGKPAGPDQ